jgi:hypothetical protein
MFAIPKPELNSRANLVALPAISRNDGRSRVEQSVQFADRNRGIGADPISFAYSHAAKHSVQSGQDILLDVGSFGHAVRGYQIRREHLHSLAVPANTDGHLSIAGFQRHSGLHAHVRFASA